MPFKFNKLSIPDVVAIEPQIYTDERGYFLENFKASDFAKAGLPQNFVQTNYSRSKKDVLRGLHYQRAPKAQAKLVQVTLGEIFDVAVDIRKGSPTYGKWVSDIISAEKRNMLYIPEGFAHGFCVLSESADVFYWCTAEYAPQAERGIMYNDTDLNIDWPLEYPIVSGRDLALGKFKEELDLE